MSSAKLKTAAEEIKDILRKHDITGAVALHSISKDKAQGNVDGDGEYFIHLGSSYSCSYQYTDEEIRFKLSKETVPDINERMRLKASTSNMLHILSRITSILAFNLHNFSEHFDKITEGIHKDV